MAAGDSLTDQQKAAALAALAESLAFATDPSDEQPWQRFATNLLQTLMRRAGESSEEQASAFVMVEKPMQFAHLAGATRVFDLDRRGTAPIGGCAFIVGEGANGGICIAGASQNDLIATIQANGLGPAPFATYYADQGAFRIYPEGVDNLDSQIEMQIRNEPLSFSFEAVVEAITQFADRNLVTPQKTMSGFWTNQSQWLPTGSAENAIQWPLRIALVATFGPKVTVIEEYETAVGDVDFVFFASDGANSDPPLGLIETKVQKSFREGGAVPPFETGKELIRGMIQVVSYAKSLKAGWGALACFDLRKPGAGSQVAWSNAEERCQRVLSTIEKREGKPLQVRNWLAFAQSEAAQAAIAMGPLVNDDPLYASRVRPDYISELKA